MPVTRIVALDSAAPATPITRLRLETRPSLAPSTAARRALPPTPPPRRYSVRASASAARPRCDAARSSVSKPGVRSFLVAERVAGLRLNRVTAPVDLLAGGHRGQEQRGTEPAGEPRQHARAAARAHLRPTGAELLELLGPARRVAPLGGCEPAIDAREALFVLRGRHRVVQDGAVDLVAVVAPQTLDALARHGATRAPRRPRRTASPPRRGRRWRGSTITGQAASRTTRPATPPTTTECSGP